MPARSQPASQHLHEFALIREIRRRFGKTGPSVICGIGDDAAVIRPSPGRVLLYTTDLLAEGIHFDLATAGFQDVGYKAAVANLSDIAAMGGIPEHLLVAIAIPPWYRPSYVRQLYQGLMSACRRHHVALIGGDTSASKDGLFLSITVTGSVSKDKILTRSGACVGDLVYVTGTLGDSLAGLNILSGHRTRRRKLESARMPKDRNGRIPASQRYLIMRHLRPTPRLKEGQLLSEYKLATAAIDLSDGLSGDLVHLCEQSRVGAEINMTALPLSPACRAYSAESRMNPFELALRGGEDYELLVTVTPENSHRLTQVTRLTGCRFSCIGRIRPKRFGIHVKCEDGKLRKWPGGGYQHFQGRFPDQPRKATWFH